MFKFRLDTRGTAMEESGKTTISSCVRGHHVYKDVWDPMIGEKLDCRRESGNVQDRYAVAVVRTHVEPKHKRRHKKNTVITVGHLPKKISCVCSLFLRRGGTITCEITGNRRHSSDLPQGGLEVPCLLVFVGNKADIAKIKNKAKI